MRQPRKYFNNYDHSTMVLSVHNNKVNLTELVLLDFILQCHYISYLFIRAESINVWEAIIGCLMSIIEVNFLDIIPNMR